MIGNNLQFVRSQLGVDKMNAEFYGRIKFPWGAQYFEKITREGFWHKMLSQDLGYWNQEILPRNSNDSTSIHVNFPATSSILLKEAKNVFIRSNENESMEQTFKKYGVSLDFNQVNTIRSCLTTSGSPFLEAVNDEHHYKQ